MHITHQLLFGGRLSTNTGKKWFDFEKKVGVGSKFWPSGKRYTQVEFSKRLLQLNIERWMMWLQLGKVLLNVEPNCTIGCDLE